MSDESMMVLLGIPAARQTEFLAVLNSQTDKGSDIRPVAARIIWDIMKGQGR
ncbi:hypothetical protein FDH96_gp076 [Mycobacterium phage Rey]|uniref:Uncharacterized protein n=1 Tax=Mycobacterium phage Rey TaxID=1034115 RepID=G1D5D8_9CAUD|nr:hypothetical protein FDH96_gp076 [Mycobacterium phage Rey]AEK09988.1 hypothetical protein PBI_REY_76 [Mycobacterium phage Rey]